MRGRLGALTLAQRLDPGGGRLSLTRSSLGILRSFLGSVEPGLGRPPITPAPEPRQAKGAGQRREHGQQGLDAHD